MQVVLLGEAVLILGHVVQHGAPAVIKGGVRLAQRNGNHLETELVRQLLGHGLITLVVQFTGIDVGAFGLNAEHVLGILLIGDAHIHVLAQFGHCLTGLSTGPQLAAVVQIAGDLHTLGLSGLTSLFANFHHVGAESRGNTGEMEPGDAFKNLVPVKVGGGRHLDGRVGAVIDAHAAPLGGTLLVEVDANTVTTPGDEGGVHAVTAQRVYSSLTDGVGGQLGDESGIHAVIG